MYGGDDVSGLVLDLGTYLCKSGYSGEECPKGVIQPEIGIMSSMTDGPSKLIGDMLNMPRSDMPVSSLLNKQGYIRDFDNFNLLIDNALIKRLHIDIKEHPVLFSEPSIHNKENRKKLAQYMFEKYEVPALYVCKSSVLAGFSAGRSTCLVLDSGENTTYAVPVHEGYALQNCIMKYEIGGSYMDAQIEKYLDSQKIGLTPKYAFKKKIFDDRTEISPIEYKDIDPSYEKFCKANLLRDIKESMLRTSDQPATEGVAIETKLMKYEMPDGQIIEMGTERMGKIECLFKEAPEIPGFMGIHRMVVDAISKTDLDIRKDLYLSIVVCGGNTLLDGFLDKLQKYLNEIAPQNVRVKLVAHSGSDRKFSSWIGGSILTSLGSFQQMWVSKQEFHEHGDVIIERKCA